MFFESIEIGDVLVSSGRVMRPDEVKESLADRPTMRERVNGWYLCGDVQRGMFDALVGSQGHCTMQMSVFEGGVAGNYGIFTQQAGRFRHRFLLPMFEPLVVQLLQSLQHEPVQLSLGRQSEDDAILVQQRLPWWQVAEVLRFAQRPSDIQISEVFAAGRPVLDMARDAGSVACFSGLPRPAGISVSFVMPEEAFSLHEQPGGYVAVSNVVH